MRQRGQQRAATQPSDSRRAGNGGGAASPRIPPRLLPVALVLLVANVLLFTWNEIQRSQLPPELRPLRLFDFGALASSVLRERTASANVVISVPSKIEPMPIARVWIDSGSTDNIVASARNSALREALHAAGAQLAESASDASIVLVFGEDTEWVGHEKFLSEARRGGTTLRRAIGAVLGLDETLGDVSGLSHALALCAAQHGRTACAGVATALPPVMAMPGQSVLWQLALEQHPHWLVRPHRGSSSAHQMMRIVSAARKTALPTSKSGLGYLLQPYIAQPRLWRGRKHSVRFVAVLASVRPLRLYLSRAGAVRVAARAYPDASRLNASLDDACVHATTPSVALGAACAAGRGLASPLSFASGADAVPQSTDDPSYALGLSAVDEAAAAAEDAAEYLHRIQLDEREGNSDANGSGGGGGALHATTATPPTLWRPTARAVRAAVLAALPLLSGYADMLHAAGAAYTTSAVLAVDVVPTANGDVYIEQMHAPDGLLRDVTATGAAAAGGSSDGGSSSEGGRSAGGGGDAAEAVGGAHHRASLLSQATIDALRLLGVGGYDARRVGYAARVQSLVRSVCEGESGVSTRACDDEAHAALWALADEAAHAGTGESYARLWPPATQQELDSIGPLALRARDDEGALGNVTVEFARRLGELQPPLSAAR